MDNSWHTRHFFDAELTELEHSVLEMASRAETMVGQAVESLIRVDRNLVKVVLEADDEVDEMDLAIENQCLRMIGLQHPIAGDLRLVGTVMKVITDIERVGDLAVDIARITLKIEQEFGEPNVIDIPKIAGVARGMLRLSIEAFVKRDLALVERVIQQDDEVDNLYRDLRGQLHANMKANPDMVVTDSWLLLAIH